MEKKIKKHTNWVILIMLCVYEFFIVSFIFIIAYITIYHKYIAELLTILIILILLGLFISDWILWQIKGYEIIKMNKETLTIKKKGKIFSIPENIKLSQIKNIYFKNYEAPIYMLFLKIIGIEGGKICIDYSGGSIYVGQSLTNEEALECINEMNEYWHEACNPCLVQV